MKKQLLIFTLAIPLIAFSQKPTPNSGLKQPANAAVTVDKTTKRATDSPIADSTVNNGQVRSGSQSSDYKRGFISYSFVKVGMTYYDLQTNASMGRRIQLLPDGKVSLAWTTSNSNDANFVNRGTGYNHFDGSNWLNLDYTKATPRVEGVRLGWPSIGLNGNKEWVMGHNATNGGFVMSTNSAIGSNTWTSGSSILTENGRRPIWGRVMNSGDIFHCIASYSDSTTAGDPRAPKIKGITAPMTYSRSLDGGVNWDIQHIMLPGYDSSRYIDGGGDQYAIDVKDSVVVIVTGDLLSDVAMWKSTDNGTTFTKVICDSFKYAPYNQNSITILDTPFVCDGSLDVLIDNDYKAHVFWGVSRVLDTGTFSASYSFYPSTALLAYWNENTQTRQFISGASEFDRNDDDSMGISPANWFALANGLVPAALKNAPYNASSVGRLGNTALLRMPSAGMDANGNIFVTFSFPVEDDVDPNNLNLRDIMMVHSTDGGANWAKSQDVTQWLGAEEDFACIARQANDFVHMVFQKDDYAGTNLQNNSSVDNNHPIDLNSIYYAAIPVAKILDGSIGNLYNVGIQRYNANQEVFVVSQNYPNPFSNTSEVLIWLDTESEVTVEILNVSGQVVSTQSYGTKGAGNHNLTMEADGLAAGIYFYTVKTATHSVTKKMTIN